MKNQDIKRIGEETSVEDDVLDGRVNEILGQGHAIYNFCATLYNSPDSKKYSRQFPIEFKFTSRPKGCSINGGPLLYKTQGEDWQEYPGKDSIE
ncbi:hypothetical protein D0469_06560 [Peribacillus saganii]|uniref:Uncharacterized protein n=1 Tax=Peribacillus saganii TaxID=2303992 RepID=A0A372LQT1_9BACI|nr:hypothetical protein [Peribacillus saganii]RFU70583.1 hypothetical protein D0469_06560 [Peribacillus saganii]